MILLAIDSLDPPHSSLTHPLRSHSHTPMRVLLVRPPVPPHTVGLKHIMICEPLELEYVAAGIGPEHDVEILDLILEKGWDGRGLERRLKKFRPDVIGTSSYINGVNEVKKICRAAKRWNRACTTIVGGVHAAREPEDFSDPAVDVIVTGDGTTVIQSVLDAIEAGAPVDDIPGLAVPTGPREVWKTPATKHYMPPPDSLPFPRRDRPGLYSLLLCVTPPQYPLQCVVRKVYIQLECRRFLP